MSCTIISGCDGYFGGAQADPAQCDRDCIITLTNAYVDALLDNQPGNAPLADDARLAENLVPASAEQGIWQHRFESPARFEVHVPDPLNQQAGWMGVVNIDDKPVLLALRLRIHEGQISEAEHLFAQVVDGNQANLSAAHPAMEEDVAEEDRLDHGDLIRIGASYYNALDGNDGSLSPFAANCLRIENGLVAAGEGAPAQVRSGPFRPGVANDCRSQIDSQAFVYIDRIENRRMVAADPVTGLVMGFSQFRHSMENLPYKVTLWDGTTAEINRENMPQDPFDLAAAHIFKVGPDGTISTIEAVGVRMPFQAPSAWE